MVCHVFTLRGHAPLCHKLSTLPHISEREICKKVERFIEELDYIPKP